VKNEVSLEGSVVKVQGELLLLIPLTDGGSDLVGCSRGFPGVGEEFLKIVIPEWLAGMLDIEEGDVVRVQADGKLHVNASNSLLVH